MPLRLSFESDGIALCMFCQGLIFKNKNSYKDFISVDKFCEIVDKLLISNVSGIYNVSLGKKIYLVFDTGNRVIKSKDLASEITKFKNNIKLARNIITTTELFADLIRKTNPKKTTITNSYQHSHVR